MKETVAVLHELAAGALSTRTDPSRYRNESRVLVEGDNVTLSALLAPSEEATRVMGMLAQRDLRARMTGSCAGDHAKLKEATNATAEALREALAQVAEVVEQVSSSSTRIAASSQAVASGASEQASSLASDLSITRQATNSAQQANTLAQTARAAATEGAAAVEQMQGAIGKTKQSAEHRLLSGTPRSLANSR